MPAALVLAGLLACAGEPLAAAVPGASGWRDDAGRLRLHRGMNVANAAKTADGLRADLDDATLALLPAYGVDLVRYLVFWQGVEPEDGAIDAGYLDGVAEDVERLRDAGVDVVIDLHQDVWGQGFGYTGFPRWTCDEASYAAFTPNGGHWALDYADPAVVACFDAFWASEELQGRYAAAAAAVHARVADALRDADPDAWIAVEPSAHANLLGTSHLVLPDVDRVLYAPHFYPTYAELGDGWDGDFADEAAWLDGLFREDAPLWLGEFGIFSDVGNEPDWVRAVLSAVEARGGSTAYWSFDPGNVLADGGGAGWLLPAWASPRPTAVPGQLVSLATASDGFDLTYDATVDAPLRVMLPPAGCATVEVAGDPPLDGEGALAATGVVELRGEVGVRQVVMGRCG